MTLLRTIAAEADPGGKTGGHPSAGAPPTHLSPEKCWTLKLEPRKLCTCHLSEAPVPCAGKFAFSAAMFAPIRSEIESYGRSPALEGLRRAKAEIEHERNWSEWSALMHAEPV